MEYNKEVWTPESLVLALIYNDDSDDMLEHYGIPRRSGRYPWGSGEHPFQSSGDFLSYVNKLKKSGFSEKEIADHLLISTGDLRSQKAQAKAERTIALASQARSLRDQGYSLQAIANEMGFKNDSSVRNLLNEGTTLRANKVMKTAEYLKQQIDEKGVIDVGAGVERELGVSSVKMKEALDILEAQGYVVTGGRVPQINNKDKQTTLLVAGPPGTAKNAAYKYGEISTVTDYSSKDDGETFQKLEKPSSLDSKRLMIRYADDPNQSGELMDGVIELRRGVKDLSLGNSHYAQVRILVDGTHYLKGMAVYADDLPDGVDVRFNTNKTSDKSMTEVLKKIKTIDPNNPFGSLISASGQYKYIDDDGNEQLSPINKTREEGEWGEWSNRLPSQFLAKQPMKLINRQLNESLSAKQDELSEINSLTNPTLKKHLLESFAEDCESQAVSLYAASLPRQKYQVILPVPDMKDTEVFAPGYRDGETVVLIRYPHGGTFEIPRLTVNNKQKTAVDMYTKNPLDAVGISSNVAQQLSGADFDGDTVMVIPVSENVNIKTKKPLDELKGFDPKLTYATEEKNGKYYAADGHEVKTMGKKLTQKEMGVVSNLIMDMTLKGADESELARAVKHSMVVIDAEKHKLDYKQSYSDNGIAALKETYQGHIGEDGNYHEGAATLLTRAKSPKEVLKRRGSTHIDPETGNLVYKEVVETFVDPKTGKTRTRTQNSTKMAETDDARTLMSNYDTPTTQELAYANFANALKELARTARKTLLSVKETEYSPEAKAKYEEEVKTLKGKLELSEANRPRERAAQLIANARLQAIKEENPNMEKEEIKKYGQRYLREARESVGAERKAISITPKEYEAANAGAISHTTFSRILKYADQDQVREYATPKTQVVLSPAKQARIRTLYDRGYTLMQIADALGVSRSTITKYLKKE